MSTYLMPACVVALYGAAITLTGVTGGWRISAGFAGEMASAELGWHGCAACLLACLSFALTRLGDLVPGVSIAIPFVLGLALSQVIARRHRSFEPAPPRKHWTDGFLQIWGLKEVEDTPARRDDKGEHDD